MEINGAKIDGLRRLPCPAQSDVPRRITRGTEANIRVWDGQDAGRDNFGLKTPTLASDLETGKGRIRKAEVAYGAGIGAWAILEYALSPLGSTAVVA